MIGSGGNVLGHPLEVVAWLANDAAAARASASRAATS